MKEIIVASTNQGKIKEIKAMLKDIDIEVLSMKDVLEQELEIEETGTTFKENALIKAQTIANIVNKPVLADDSGLEVDALDKQPGIYSARFLGADTSYNIKNQYIIDALKDKERTARFVCAMALVIPGQEPILIEETMEGLINDKIEGANGFGYDPIFYFPPCQMTSAMMSMEEKNKYSHRAKALKKLYTILIMRTCVATHSKLHIIKPMSFDLDDKKMKRAGLDYVKDLNLYVYENYEEFEQKNPGEYHFFTRYSHLCYTDQDFSDDKKEHYLFFGHEHDGIPKEILTKQLDRCVRIPMSDKVRSLNLSNCAAICIYEVLRQQSYPNLSKVEVQKGEDFLYEL